MAGLIFTREEFQPIVARAQQDAALIHDGFRGVERSVIELDRHGISLRAGDALALHFAHFVEKIKTCLVLSVEEFPSANVGADLVDLGSIFRLDVVEVGLGFNLDQQLESTLWPGDRKIRTEMVAPADRWEPYLGLDAEAVVVIAAAVGDAAVACRLRRRLRPRGRDPGGHFVYLVGAHSHRAFVVGLDHAQARPSGRRHRTLRLGAPSDLYRPHRGEPCDRRVARHGMAGCFANRRCELQAMVEPFANFPDHAHGDFSDVRLATGSPGVGSCPASIVSTPFSILYGYSKSPRSGGPDAREPSR